MRSVPLTVAELQLSSPLPSPSRHSVIQAASSNNKNNTSDSHLHHHHTIYNYSSSSTKSTRFDPVSTTTTNTMVLPPLQFDYPYTLNPDLYPLAAAPTPPSIKKFTFSMDGKPSLFEEVHVSDICRNIMCT